MAQWRLRRHTFAQHCLRAIVSTHAMYAAARWCGGRTEVDTCRRCAVRGQAQAGPGKVLKEILYAAVDVAAHVVWVIGLPWLPHGTSPAPGFAPGNQGQSAPPGPRWRLLYPQRSRLARDSRPRPLVCPQAARRIEKALLGEQHVGSRWMLATPDSPFGGGDFVKRAAHMHSGRMMACVRRPRDLLVQRQSILKTPGLYRKRSNWRR